MFLYGLLRYLWLCCIRPVAGLPIPRLVLSFLLLPLGESTVHLLLNTVPVADSTSFCSVEFGRLTCPFPVVPLSYSESHYWPQHLEIGPAVISSHCACRALWSCVHHSAWKWCSSLSVWTQSTEPLEGRQWSCISQSHVCPWPWATCQCIFLSSHISLWSAVAYLFDGCQWAHLPAVVECLIVFTWVCHCWSVQAYDCSDIDPVWCSVQLCISRKLPERKS